MKKLTILLVVLALTCAAFAAVSLAKGLGAGEDQNNERVIFDFSVAKSGPRTSGNFKFSNGSRSNPVALGVPSISSAEFNGNTVTFSGPGVLFIGGQYVQVAVEATATDAGPGPVGDSLVFTASHNGNIVYSSTISVLRGDISVR
jgi:hypothetical protein